MEKRTRAEYRNFRRWKQFEIPSRAARAARLEASGSRHSNDFLRDKCESFATNALEMPMLGSFARAAPLVRTDMEATVAKKPLAWQPFTPRGAAAFARAPLGRLLLVQLAIALLAAGLVVWFATTAWFPVINEAVGSLPSQGEIRYGELRWPGGPRILGENRFLGLAVDLDHSGSAHSPAQVSIEFGRKGLKAYSLLGYLRLEYPLGWRYAFNRTEVGPAWGAWRPAILAITAIVVLFALIASWAVLASIYFLPAWAAGFFTNRELGPSESWRLCGAALMPGAVFFCLAILLYGAGALDLIQLLAIAALHLVIGWVWLALSIRALPRAETAIPRNPFAPEASATAAENAQANAPKIES
ncbi:MAG TPA: hypothetical protein VHH88_09345 [Verrucomicrobiae bacterium]|nr:hypothetical protein [Verrucomicrobiae bacterium]